MKPLTLRRQKQFLLHLRAVECANQYRKLEAELLDLIQQIDTEKLFRDLGYSSLFAYVVSALKLSENQAYNFIHVARKATEVPELKTQIKSGALSVSKARKIVPVLTRANKNEWIQKAVSLPQKEIERQVADAQPSLSIPERLRPKGNGRTELRCGLSTALENKLKRAQDVLSSKRRKSLGIEATLEAVLDFFLKRQDPVVKARRAKINNRMRELSSKKQQNRRSVPLSKKQEAQTGEKALRPAKSHRGRQVPSSVRHAVNWRDAGRCRYREPSGERCSQGRWVELQHIRLWANGGTHDVSNLITLCWAHHQGLHGMAPKAALLGSTEKVRSG